MRLAGRCYLNLLPYYRGLLKTAYSARPRFGGTSAKPIVLYNIPYLTGVNLSTIPCCRCSAHARSSHQGLLRRSGTERRNCCAFARADFSVMSRDDALFLPRSPRVPPRHPRFGAYRS